MRQKLLIISGTLIIILLAIIGLQQYQLYQTKQYSPGATVQYISDDIRIEVIYSRPSKKGRVIFGELVPYGEWWRTGANEPTTISLSRDVIFNSSDTLKAGVYSIISIPHENHWQLIFNRAQPDWGTDYDPTQNVLETTMQVSKLPQSVEQFMIDFTENENKSELVMAWDRTIASAPFRVL